MAELRRVAGTQLDPDVVEAFVAAHPHPERLPLSA
jgi:HD-GYP domain-containing protein (c-di-GMP phosphodiesterase class II)